MITLVQAPDHYELPEASYAFYFDSGSNSLLCRPFAAPGTCASPYTLAIGSAEQECLDYITENNITIPEWLTE